MAKGDLTKEIEYDKIEVVNTWSIQVRQATKIMEEQADGSKNEINRSFHRHILVPFNSYKDEKDAWKHTDTDLSKEDAQVKAIATAAWTSTVKTKYKAWKESI